MHIAIFADVHGHVELCFHIPSLRSHNFAFSGGEQLHPSPGHAARLLLATTLLVALFAAQHEVRPALAAGPATTFFLLTTDNRIAALTDALPNQPTTPVAIIGLTAGETLVDIDVRPQNGLLYGLGINATADTASLYVINPQNGRATVIGMAGQIAFVGVDLPDPAIASYGFDFNPVVDRVRVVTSTRLNFRVSPNTGAPIGFDGLIDGGTTTVDGAAYTNNAPNTSITTLYTLDSTTNSLYIQNPPNNGTQTMPLVVTLNSSTLDFAATGGFDIPPGVDAPVSNTSASGASFAMLMVGGVEGLYRIELSTGVATFLGAPGSLTLRGMAIWSPLPSGIALSANGSSLLRFRLDAPGTTTSTPTIIGITAGETLVGIDGRPATGQLYGLGINDVADTGTLYQIDPQAGVATAVNGVTGQIAFASVDLPAPSAGYGMDFNPTVDRLRVVTGTGLNFRVNPITGAPIGMVPDTPINGLPIGSTGVAAAAYTNNYAGATATTLYTIDPTSDQLFIQNPANAGTQTNGLPLTLNGASLDVSAVNGFDIPPGASVATTSAPATSNAYAMLTVGGTTGLYRINLASGAATALGALGTGATSGGGFVAWSEVPAAQVTAAATTVSESIGTVKLTVTSTGGAPMIASYSVGNGSATPGSDYTAISGTLLLGGSAISQTLSLPIINDTLPENNETVEVHLLGAAGVAQTLTLTIRDNDAAARLSAANYTGSEVRGTALLTVTLSQALATSASVKYATADGTAKAGSDYTASSGTLTFAPGQTSKTLSVPILGDHVIDAGEAFTISLSAPVGVALGTPSSAQVIITDDRSGYKLFLPLIKR
ncbi:MAG: DUF4394 domain-containing protein [Roseiflexaceae bacterium]